MFYRLDGSDYLFVDWEKLDACKSPDDKDARGRRCGQRATSYKGAKKSVGNLGKTGLSADKSKRLAELRSKVKSEDRIPTAKRYRSFNSNQMASEALKSKGSANTEYKQRMTGKKKRAKENVAKQKNWVEAVKKLENDPSFRFKDGSTASQAMTTAKQKLSAMQKAAKRPRRK